MYLFSSEDETAFHQKSISYSRLNDIYYYSYFTPNIILIYIRLIISVL